MHYFLDNVVLVNAVYAVQLVDVDAAEIKDD
jgi:hypothetical protein